MSKMGEKFTEQQAKDHMSKVWVTHWDNRFDPPLPYKREKGDDSMGKSGEKFTEERAKEYEDRGANRSDELADLLTITEMSNIIEALSLAAVKLDGHPRSNEVLAIRIVMYEARTIAQRNEYAGDYDYPEAAS